MAYDMNRSPIIADGWTTILNILTDKQWHPFTELHQASGLAERTVENLLRWGSKTNQTTRHGKPIRQCQVRLKQ